MTYITVGREIVCSVSVLVSELRRRATCLSGEDQSALLDLTMSSRDFEEPAADAGWCRVPSGGDYVFINRETAQTIIISRAGDADPWEMVCHAFGLDLPWETARDEFGLSSSAGEYELCATDDGWVLCDDTTTFYNTKTGEQSTADGWEDLCADHSIDPHESEAHEHWAVPSWLGEELRQRGQTVRTLLGLVIWARGATDRVVPMDQVIREICNNLVNPGSPE